MHNTVIKLEQLFLQRFKELLELSVASCPPLYATSPHCLHNKEERGAKQKGKREEGRRETGEGEKEKGGGEGQKEDGGNRSEHSGSGGGSAPVERSEEEGEELDWDTDSSDQSHSPGI